MKYHKETNLINNLKKRKILQCVNYFTYVLEKSNIFEQLLDHNYFHLFYFILIFLYQSNILI